MRTPDAAFRRRLLTEALTVVAASAPAQTAWLERHGVVTDEIALDLDHGFRMAGQLVEEGLLHPAALPDLRAIDSIFDEMTRDPSPGRWSTAALFEDAGWGRARALARRVLVREGVDASVLPEICVIR
ncbi:hypothetical protein [Streptomyces murinus]|uniref:hypothetical protein n=1 Tax=Streptomyces murinus TaxID=33900 RepID=UPI0021154CDC|nr:hypothetical protein [Streptomyces murinus]